MGNVGSFGQQGMQGVFTGSARRCIKMISERNRDNLINIDMGFVQEKMPYLCGLWRLANAYVNI